MLLIVSTVLGVYINGEASAEIKCGDQPNIHIPIDRAEGFKADAAGKALLLSRVLPSADISGKVDEWNNERRQEYQNLDQQELRLYSMWVSCQMISSSTQMSDHEKQQQWTQVITAFGQLPVSHRDDVPPTDKVTPAGQPDKEFKLDGGQTTFLTDDRLIFAAIGTPIAGRGDLIGIKLEGKTKLLAVGDSIDFPFSRGTCRVTVLGLIKKRQGGQFLLRCS